MNSCRYCARGVDREPEPGRRAVVCDECTARLDLHRTKEGMQSCPDCGRHAVVTYRCTGCDEQFAVPGAFRWHWQGKGHWHEADDDEGWQRTVFEHWRRHDGRSMVVPEPCR